jgi:hypothetical protein
MSLEILAGIRGLGRARIETVSIRERWRMARGVFVLSGAVSQRGLSRL